VYSRPQPNLILRQIPTKLSERAHLGELVKNKLDGRSHLLVRIQFDVTCRKLYVPTGYVDDEFAPLSLVEFTSFQSIMHHYQFIFAQRSLKPKEKAVVGISWII
jgi:hypothetical protein